MGRIAASLLVGVVSSLAFACADSDRERSSRPETVTPMTDEERWRELEREAEERGLVPVIVTLEVEWEPEGDLPPQQRAVQQRRIAEARQALLRELEGTSVENVRGYAAVPQVTMSVGPDAIMALRRSPHVQAVVEDVPAPLEP